MSDFGPFREAVCSVDGSHACPKPHPDNPASASSNASLNDASQRVQPSPPPPENSRQQHARLTRTLLNSQRVLRESQAVFHSSLQDLHHGLDDLGQAFDTLPSYALDNPPFDDLHGAHHVRHGPRSNPSNLNASFQAHSTSASTSSLFSQDLSPLFSDLTRVLALHGHNAQQSLSSYDYSLQDLMEQLRALTLDAQ